MGSDGVLVENMCLLQPISPFQWLGYRPQICPGRPWSTLSLHPYHAYLVQLIPYIIIIIIIIMDMFFNTRGITPRIPNFIAFWKWVFSILIWLHCHRARCPKHPMGTVFCRPNGRCERGNIFALGGCWTPFPPHSVSRCHVNAYCRTGTTIVSIQSPPNGSRNWRNVLGYTKIT